jgi:hypothetical protein
MCDVQLYPKITLGSIHMYKSTGWRTLVSIWEVLIYNPLIDLESWWLVLLVLGAAGLFALRNLSAWFKWLRSKRLVSEGGRDLSV